MRGGLEEKEDFEKKVSGKEKIERNCEGGRKWW